MANGNHSVHQSMLIKLRPLIWEVRNFLLGNSDLELNKLQLLRCHLLHLPAPIAFRLLLKLGTKDFRGQSHHCFKYVSEFHSKLKAFMSDSKWKTQPGASSSWKFLSSQTMGHSLTLTGVNKFYQWDQFGMSKSPAMLHCRGLYATHPYGNAKVVTRWSQGCSIVTRLLQTCYHLVQNTKVVTSLVTRLSQGCQMVITLSQGCYTMHGCS